MPLTMTEERLLEIRAFAEVEGPTSALAKALNELDAERAVHQLTKDALALARCVK